MFRASVVSDIVASIQKGSAVAKDKHTLPRVLRELTVTQIWLIGGAIVGLLSGMFSLGVFAESIRNSTIIADKSLEISTLKGQLTDKDRTIRQSQEKYDDLDRNFKALGERITKIAESRAAFDMKVEFLNRMVAYLTLHDQTSTNLLRDYVCVMWRDSTKRSLGVERGRLNLDLSRGLSSSERDLLLRLGVSPTDLESVEDRRGLDRGAEVTRPARQKLEKYADGAQLAKRVIFPDGSKYDIPQDIAAAVHNRTECGPL